MKFLWKLLKMFLKIRGKRSTRIVIPAPKKKRKKAVMTLILGRIWYTEKSTIGELYIDGEYECFILEDYDRLKKNRRKVYGETAIPRGTYEIRNTYSKRFKKKLPLLLSVPGFSGIRIHAGNTAKDTEGCLLPGTTRDTNSVGQSKRAFRKLYKKLERAKSENRKIVIKIDPV